MKIEKNILRMGGSKGGKIKMGKGFGTASMETMEHSEIRLGYRRKIK